MSVISNAKEIAELIKKLGDVELYKKIVELEGEIIELTREKHSFEVRVEELQKVLQISKDMNFKEPFYYVEGDNVPFCPKCWEGDSTSVHLFNRGVFSEGETKFECHHCKSVYWFEGHHA